jgi:hypothetical protein
MSEQAIRRPASAMERADASVSDLAKVRESIDRRDAVNRALNERANETPRGTK